MKKYIIANWKELPASLGEAEEILDFLGEEFAVAPIGEVGIIICPPAKYVEKVAELLQKPPLSDYVELGAQDIGLNDKEELNKLGARYVIIGHSDRRYKLDESEQTVNKKLKLALSCGLTPIVCIGERSREGDYKKFLESQVAGTFAGLSIGDLEKCFVAYEPVWAISTNPNAKSDTPESAAESVKIIKNCIDYIFHNPNSVFLYGGSVNIENVRDFLFMPEISGVLVGGASVNKEEFLEIIKAV
jgi:triosephosphate isomerase (TIM)